MPWQERLPMDLRMQFVLEWQSGCWTMTELCADYQISRKTGYRSAGTKRAAPAGCTIDRAARIIRRRPPTPPLSRPCWPCDDAIPAGARGSSW
jgi:hypothetical protein